MSSSPYIIQVLLLCTSCHQMTLHNLNIFITLISRLDTEMQELPQLVADTEMYLFLFLSSECR